MKIRVVDFTIFPNTRHRDEGEGSGEQFFEEYLKPAYEKAVAKNESLEVDLDGTEGYATSFLDESFGLLAEFFGSNEVLNRLKIISLEEPDWENEIKSYILERK